MIKRQRLTVLVFLMAAALAFGITLLISPDPEAHSSHELDIDWVHRLEMIRDAMRADGGAFYSGTLSAVSSIVDLSGAELATELSLQGLAPMWSAQESTSKTLVVNVLDLPEVDRSALATLPVPLPVDLALSESRHLVLFGVTDGEGGEDYVDLPDSGSGPVFLDVVAKRLISGGYLRDQSVDVCDPAKPLTFEHGRRAVLAVLETVPTPPRDYFLEAGVIAEGAGALVDPVTGEAVDPAINDIARQLRDGVNPSAVEIRGQVPMAVRLPDQRQPDVAVFVAEQSGTVLGFIHRDPAILGRRAANEEAIALIEISPPARGEPVQVYLRPSNSNFTCPVQGEQPFATISEEGFGAEARARVDLRTGDVMLGDDLG